MDNNDRKKELFSSAMKKMMNDKLGESIDLLDEVITHDPDDRLAFMARGTVYLKMGNGQNATLDFSRAIEINESHPKAYHLRGLARELAGDNDGALSDISKAIELDPEYGAAFYSRATLLTKMGREDAAAEDMKMVTHLTNRNLEEFANDNNIWRSRQMQLEGILESEMNR
jgi:Tfp pilus assembly protein PilF